MSLSLFLPSLVTIGYVKAKNISNNVFLHKVLMATLNSRSHFQSHTKSGLFVQNIEVINPIKFQNIGTCSFRVVDLRKLAKQKLEWLWWPSCWINKNQKYIFCIGSCMHHFFEVWLKLVNGFSCSLAKCKKNMMTDGKWWHNITRTFGQVS